MAKDQPKSSENREGFCLDTLIALIERGPCWDGDVPSKAGRNDLIDNGYAIRVVHNGNDGYTAATYKGRDLYNSYYGGDTLSQSMANRKRQLEERANRPMYHPV